ncbi:MAG: hypothetical protein GEV10_31635 [Streptosporangiales bacterium]|nr:hypothetical protein [Streptosporangiales bacterium]
MVDRAGRVNAALCSGTGRAVRAVAVAVVATLVAVLCHVAGGGTAPNAATVGLVLAVAVPLCFWLSDRAWTTRQLAAVFLLAQGFLHGVAVFTIPDHAMADTSTAAMLGWHLVATAVSVAVVRHGETCLWATADALGLRAYRIAFAPRPLPAVGETWQPVAIGDTPPDHQHHVRARPLRGPPLPA